MFLLLLTIALVAAANASSVTRERPMFPAGRIVGGNDAEITTYPYQISMQLFGEHLCGGSIIDENYVVTACHCVDDLLPRDITVRAGSSKIGQGGSVHEVTKVIRHENYNTNIYSIPSNDVALLKLNEPIHFDDTRQPIDLFKQGEVSAPGNMSVITGWGDTGKGISTQLQTVTIPIVDKNLCNNVYKRYGGVPAGEICAGYYGIGGKDACIGDSGGPLTINGRLAGIISWGFECGSADYPGVYTEIAYYHDWIKKHIQP
ncbi:trypsin-1-like [Phymastichus coffea]|uniref:trypsin-1-like n=1 Tax=Phymastichus coffea TaxID=108790 RepID=UPI00273B8B29|nr:trypsin-1-like [Phymastichus coffea]